MTTQSLPSVRRERASRGSRLFGYLLGSVLQVALFWLVNVDPGWRAVPFLTEDAVHVVWVFNLSLVIGLVINAIWLVYDPIAVRRLGDAINAAASLAFLARALDVFPFDFSSEIWTTTVRVGLIISVVGTGIAVVVNLVLAARAGRE